MKLDKTEDDPSKKIK